jgi:hypothetical protein
MSMGRLTMTMTMVMATTTDRMSPPFRFADTY